MKDIQNKTYDEYLEIINSAKWSNKECIELDIAIFESTKLIESGNCDGNGKKTGDPKKDGFEMDDLVLKLNAKFHYLKSDPLYKETK